MAIQIFRKPYTLRAYAPQTNNNGYATATYSDRVVRLNVQPLSADDLKVMSDGDRAIKRIKSFGSDRLQAANELDGTAGVRLYYNGAWYECTSSVMWDHTILAHYRSDFAILPQASQMPPPGEDGNA